MQEEKYSPILLYSLNYKETYIRLCSIELPLTFFYIMIYVTSIICSSRKVINEQSTEEKEHRILCPFPDPACLTLLSLLYSDETSHYSVQFRSRLDEFDDEYLQPVHMVHLYYTSTHGSECLLQRLGSDLS